jgi:hypothetical protein
MRAEADVDVQIGRQRVERGIAAIEQLRISGGAGLRAQQAVIDVGELRQRAVDGFGRSLRFRRDP